MGTESPKLNQLFDLSQWCIHTSLVKYHPLIQEIWCIQTVTPTPGIRTETNMSPPHLWWGDIIILKSVHWSWGRWHLKVFQFLALVVIFFKRSGQFTSGRGSPKEHFCEIILKSVHWSRGICHLNIFLFLALAAILFSGAERF